MDTLDRPSLPDPTSVSNRALALRYGAIWGGVSILVSLVGFLSNTDPAMPDAGPLKWVYMLVGFGAAIWAVTTAIKTDRDQQLGGYISVGRCVGLGALIGLIAGAIGGVWMLLYTTIINPGFQDQMKEAMVAQWEAQGMTEEQIEMAAGMSSMFTGPVFMAISQVIGGAIFGLIIGLVAGLIMKRDRPHA
jgi:hypothetical protein